MWPAAIASVLGFATSELVRYQAAEARFYGMLTALVACAIYLYSVAVTTPRFTPRLFVLTALVHAGLLYTHMFGPVYSAAILAAWVIADRVQRRPLDARYLSVILAWVSFVPWLPALRHLAAVGRPQNWIPLPSWQELVTQYAFTLDYFPVIVAAIVAVGIAVAWARNAVGSRSPTGTLPTIAAGVAVLAAALWYVPRRELTPAHIRDAWTSSNSVAVLTLVVIVALQHLSLRVRTLRRGASLSPVTAADESLLIVSGALLAVPVVAYIVSQLVTSISLDRYFIPASLGLLPIVAHFARWTAGGSVQDEVDRSPTRPRQALGGAAWAGLVMLIAVKPAWDNRHLVAQPRPGREIEAVAPPGATVVVESVLDLLPLRQYQRRRDIAYVYPLDRDAAHDPHSWLGASVEYNLLDNWRRVGYLDAQTSSGTHVPCEGRPFVVVHSWRLSWYNKRIASDTAFATHRIGQSWSTFEKSGIILVQPRGSMVPAMCRDSVTDGSSSARRRT
jgi:hypothetical protein